MKQNQIKIKLYAEILSWLGLSGLEVQTKATDGGNVKYHSTMQSFFFVRARHTRTTHPIPGSLYRAGVLFSLSHAAKHSTGEKKNVS